MFSAVAVAVGFVLIGTLVILLSVVALGIFATNEWLLRIAPWLVYAMVIPATGFPALYLSFYKWYKNPIGRALMTKAIGLALLIDISAFFNYTKGQYGWAEEIQIVVFLLVMCGLWYQFFVFCKIRWSDIVEKRKMKLARPAPKEPSNSA